MKTLSRRYTEITVSHERKNKASRLPSNLTGLVSNIKSKLASLMS